MIAESSRGRDRDRHGVGGRRRTVTHDDSSFNPGFKAYSVYSMPVTVIISSQASRSIGCEQMMIIGPGRR